MGTIRNSKDSPFQIWQAVGTLAGGIFSALSAGKAAKEAQRAIDGKDGTKAARNKAREAMYNLDVSNPFEGMQNAFAGMENKMEDLTVNQKEAEFASQQFAQSQSNIMSGLRGAAGGSGIAALAQSLAQQGQLAAQKSAAGIGQQEATNQMRAAQAASNIQLKERSGAADVANRIAMGDAAAQTRDLQKTSAIFDDASKEHQTAQAKADAANLAKGKAWGSAIEGAVGAIPQIVGAVSDRRLKKNIKLIGKSPSGLKIYAFEYIDKFFGDGIYQGVMSDEIPSNTVINNGGYDRVNYSRLDVEFKKL
tara:strand:+ start:682 stop:1602 length:921 start_codon:yes stop_codon:yes gene_type:complete